MKYIKLLTIVATCLLVTTIFSVIPAFSVQPPVNQNVYYVGTVGMPSNLDPARAYDTASGEIIQNVYQTLIWYSNKNPIAFASGVGYNMTDADVSDVSQYAPYIATEVPTEANGRIKLNLDGSQDWTFTINPNAQFQTWTAANGTVMGPQNVSVADVVYSFQRQMVYDSDMAPTWMWYQTAINPNIYTWADFFGTPSDSGLVDNALNSTNEPIAQALIQGWVYASGGMNVTFHFDYPYPHVAMYQIFANTWGSILEKDWVIQRGGWNGLWLPGWSKWYRQTPSDDFSELDVYKDQATFPGDGGNYAHPYSYYPGVTGSNHVPDMLGTGPYNFTTWDQTAMYWRLDANDHYWMGWSQAGDKAYNYIHTVIETEVDTWTTRKMLFLNGEFDTAYVPTSQMHDVLVGDDYTPLPGLYLAYNIPELVTDEFFFCTNVSTSSPYPTWIGGPGGHIETDATFFADQYIRTAFAWAFNYSEYIADVDFNEAILHATWWTSGLTPVNANDSWLTPRNLDYAQMKIYLDQAALVDGHNVSQVGFDVTIPYNAGNVQRQVAAQAMADAWNSMPGSGGKYKVNVVSVTWAHFLSLCLYSKQAAAYVVGWLADFADAVDFAGVYMSSSGSYGGHQGPPFPADQARIDFLVSDAATQTNDTLRVLEYQELEGRYYNDCMSFPIDQPTGRHYSRDWLEGWYYNPLYPGLYAFDLYKSPYASFQNIDVDITHTLVPITKYSTIYVWHGAMMIGNQNTGPCPPMVWFVNTSRDDNNLAVGLVYASLGIGRQPGELGLRAQFPNSTYVILGPGGNASKTFTWYEDGTAELIMGNYTGTTSSVTYTYIGESYPVGGAAVNVNDTQLGNNHVTAGTFVAKTLAGDINADGIVDIYDAVVLSGAFGTSTGDKLYNKYADFNGDGTIDIYDAILLAGSFGGLVATA